MNDVTKRFMESLTKEKLIEFIIDVTNKRNEKEAKMKEEYQKILQENIILKDKLSKISKIINSNHEGK